MTLKEKRLVMHSVRQISTHPMYLPAKACSVASLCCSLASTLSALHRGFTAPPLLWESWCGAPVCGIPEANQEWPECPAKVSITVLGLAELAWPTKASWSAWETVPRLPLQELRVCLWSRSDNVNWIGGEVSPPWCHYLMFILKIRYCCWWV